MQIKTWKKEKSLLSLIFIVSVFVIITMVFFAKDFCFYGDDFFLSTYDINESIFDCLSFNYSVQCNHTHGGGYIGYFLSKFISFYIPNFLSIHPCDFTKINAGIRAVFTIIALLSASKFLNIFYKSKSIFCAGFIFLCLYFFYTVLYLKTLLIGVSYNYYRYVFSLIFFNIFWYYILKHLLINYKKTNWLKLFLVSICGFIVGTSSEILFITSSLSTIFIFIYGIFSKKLYLNKNFYLPVLFLYTGIMLFVFSKAFINVSHDRGIGNFQIIGELFKSFTVEYINIYIFKFIVFWILFIILFGFSFYIAKKKKELQKVLLPVFMEISLLINIFLLIFCGRTFYIEGQFWLIHEHIIFLYGMLILFPLFMIISYLLKNLNYSRKNIIKSIFWLILLSGLLNVIIFIILFPNLFSDKLTMYKEMGNYKKYIYKTEKILRFYRLKNEIPYIPINPSNRFTYEINSYIIPNQCFENFYPFITSYYMRIYKDYDNVKYCVNDKAFERFKKEGGNFSEEELNDIKFSRLLDDDFVLNKSSKKIEKHK